MNLASCVHTSDSSAIKLANTQTPDILFKGHVWVEKIGASAYRPWRVSKQQMLALGSVTAWHPGLYRQMARTTAGVRLAFKTDAKHIYIPLELDPESAGTRAVLKYISDDALDGICVEIDRQSIYLPIEQIDSGIYIDLLVEKKAEANLSLPGMDAPHDITIYLPNLRGLSVGLIKHDGSYMQAQDVKPLLLMLGDSLAQGFVVEDPSQSFPQLLAKELGMDLLNQAIGGQVFQPGTLFSLAAQIPEPAHIVVEFGANYRYEACQERRVSRDIYLYLQEIAMLWPEVTVSVMLPTPHREEMWPTHPKSCFEKIPELIKMHVEAMRHRYKQDIKVIDGQLLLDNKSYNFVDEGHLSAKGSKQLTRRLAIRMGFEAAKETTFTKASKRERALSILRGAPTRAFALLEPIQRAAVDILFAEKSAVLARAKDGLYIVYGTDSELVEDIFAGIDDAVCVCVLEPKIVRAVSKRLNLDAIEPFRLCIHNAEQNNIVAGQTMMLDLGEALDIPIKSSCTIAELDESYLNDIYDIYDHPEWLKREVVIEDLHAGKFLGAFVEENKKELCGFIGEHANGAMGMLQVLPKYQRQGIGEALESALINKQLRKGYTPFCEVFPNNKASLALQRKLGFLLLPKNECCYLSKKVSNIDEN